MAIHVLSRQLKGLLTEDFLEIGTWCVYIDEKDPTNHCIYEQRKDSIILCYGNIYDEQYKTIRNIKHLIEQSGLEALMNVDGEFVYVELSADKVILVSDRVGLIPIYYKTQNSCLIGISTDPSLLFDNYTEDDIDYSAVNDYLRHGTLVGNKTFSKMVKVLEGGSTLCVEGDVINVTRLYSFKYSASNEEIDENELCDEIVQKYIEAIKKRIKGDGTQTGIFLSGGMDSRFLLACLNQLYPGVVKTLTFGQHHAEECHIAQECAGIYNNPFRWKKLSPNDFVKDAEKYIKITCGMDMFPQSHIIESVDAADFQQFMTGFALDAYLGGTFLNEEILGSSQKLSAYVPDHLKLLKLNCFTESDLCNVMKKEKFIEFQQYGIQDLVCAAKEYDDFPLETVVQPFAIMQRAIRMVLLREVTPGRKLMYSNPSLDLDFANSVKKLTTKQRLNHTFYQKLFCKVAETYAQIPYNNTTLPVFANLNEWKNGTKNEENREYMYERLMKSYNVNATQKLYYPHFYSDFNGYSRYDEQWKALFEHYLLNEDLFIYRQLFDINTTKRYYEEHVSGEKNRRKELLYLTSLSMFFELFLERSE